MRSGGQRRYKSIEFPSKKPFHNWSHYSTDWSVFVKRKRSIVNLLQYAKCIVRNCYWLALHPKVLLPLGDCKGQKNIFFDSRVRNTSLLQISSIYVCIINHKIFYGNLGLDKLFKHYTKKMLITILKLFSVPLVDFW